MKSKIILILCMAFTTIFLNSCINGKENQELLKAYEELKEKKEKLVPFIASTEVSIKYLASLQEYLELFVWLEDQLVTGPKKIKKFKKLLQEEGALEDLCENALLSKKQVATIKKYCISIGTPFDYCPSEVKYLSEIMQVLEKKLTEVKEDEKDDPLPISEKCFNTF